MLTGGRQVIIMDTVMDTTMVIIMATIMDIEQVMHVEGMTPEMFITDAPQE